jgi:glutamate-1-semialdehyde 2,1-aminomutase
VYQAGTLSGNPLAVTAGITSLKILRRAGTYEALEKTSRILNDGIMQAARDAGVTVSGNRVGSMFTAFFVRKTDASEGVRPVVDWPTAKRSNTEQFAVFFREMLRQGVYLAPSQFEAGFVSTAHSDSDIGYTLAAARKAFAIVAKSEAP